MNAILEVEKLSKSFGGVQAIYDFDVSVKVGEILGLIGPNGSGKTTFFNLLTGVYRPTTGRITYKGKDITGLRPDKICTHGIGRVFQHTVLFSKLTVLENIIVATHLMSELKLFAALFRTSTYRHRERKARERALEVLRFVGLEAVQDELASNLPHGHQRSLGLGMALASKPQLLLLDEPTTGMNQEETQLITDLVKKIRESGVTIILVEHNMRVIMGLCGKIVVLSYGNKIAEGSPAEISTDNAVIEAYLGAEDVA